MRTPTLAFCVTAAVAAGAVTASADRGDDAAALVSVLQSAGERVLRYVARAQHLVCLEVVHLQPLTSSWSSDGLGRTVESELHLLWSPGDSGEALAEAQALRQVLKVNGREPRDNDRNNCTTPEKQTREPQPLSMLLPGERDSYTFKIAGRTRIDQREAILVDFREVRPMAVTVKSVEGRDDCISWDVQGGGEGRLWVDAESFEVLRLDQRLGRMVDAPLPKETLRRPGSETRLTIDRMDTSIRFKTVTFKDPDETMILPVSASTLSMTRGFGSPMRTTTEYQNYKRFITSGKILGQ